MRKLKQSSVAEEFLAALDIEFKVKGSFVYFNATKSELGVLKELLEEHSEKDLK